MTVEPRLLLAWIRDLALAYAGGLVLGAPVGLTVVWLTGIEWMVTVCLLVAMALVCIALRRRDARAARAVTPAAGQVRTAAGTSTSRRVA
jgi:hypothetical protein